YSALYLSTTILTPLRSTLFPYTTLFRSKLNDIVTYDSTGKTIPSVFVAYPKGVTKPGSFYQDYGRFPSLSKFMDASRISVNDSRDRKSTRLNSSHVSISYAVFCLKKKNN